MARQTNSTQGGRQKGGFRASVKDQSGAGKLKIGEVLRKEGYITPNQLNEALEIQKKKGQRLGNIMVRLGFIEEKTIVNVLSRIHNFPAIVLDKEPSPSQEILDLLPYETAKKYMAFPLRLDGENLVVTMAEPTDTGAVEAIQLEAQRPLTLCVSAEKEIIEAYRTFYKISEEEFRSFFPEEEDAEEEAAVDQIDDFGALASEAAEGLEIATDSDDKSMFDQYSASDAPIIKLVNGILVRAVTEGISDIHIEPFDKILQVRYRQDGSLYKSMNLPLSIKNALISRVKILANLDITERRVPQDGRIKMRLGRNKMVDFRVSTLPTLWGEGIVLRILDQSSLNVDMTKLGLGSRTYATLQRCLQQPQGLLLVTGPTGSGKTVTLYSALNSLNREETKILTAEDPVEFNFKGINQVNVHNEVGMTFAAALKAFLRQDPDIIMVGEIRDMETAEIAIKAAMTGHLVFSTLHTNDAPSTIGRLVDIGIPSYMLASALTMVMSQRLARRLCPKCKARTDIDDHDFLQSIGFKEDELADLVLYGPKGCPHCNGVGYKGRVGFFELMEVTHEVGKAISAEVPEDQLRKIAINEGMKTLREAGLQKVREGVTSVEEVLRRTVLTTESLPSYMVHPEVEEYSDGESIIREKNTDIDFFMLVRGALLVVKDGKKIAEITQPGEYFGEMSAVLGEPRTASILSKGRSMVKRFPGDKLDEIIEKYPEVSKHLFKSLAGRLQKNNDLLVRLAASKR